MKSDASIYSVFVKWHCSRKPSVITTTTATYSARSKFGSFRMVRHFQRDDLSRLHIRDGDAQRCRDNVTSQCNGMQCISIDQYDADIKDVRDTCCEVVIRNHRVALRNANAIAKITNCFRRVAPSPHSGDCWEAWVVPIVNILFRHQRVKFPMRTEDDHLSQEDAVPLAYDDVRTIESGELNLAGLENAQLFLEPFIERAVVLKLQRAD